jgi:hypothetical protein
MTEKMPLTPLRRQVKNKFSGFPKKVDPQQQKLGCHSSL